MFIRAENTNPTKTLNLQLIILTKQKQDHNDNPIVTENSVQFAYRPVFIHHHI